jgi:hypothetical protein
MISFAITSLKRHQYMRNIIFALTLLSFIQFSCSNKEDGKKLAERSCGSCHEFPKAELLDKETWKEHVLPRMGAWLGMGNKDILINDMSSENDYGQSLSKSLIPNSPQISENDWQLIQEYYLVNSPEVLKTEVYPQTYKDLSDKFSFEPKQMGTLSRPASNTKILFDDKKKQFYIADNDGEVSVFDNTLKELNSIKYESTVSSIKINAGQAYDALLMGKIRPNNQSIGTLMNSDQTVIKGLFRPVYMEKSDLNQDGIEDYLICNFGYHVGKLSWYEFNANGKYQEHILLPVAGAIKTIIEDINKDGLPDIIVLMAQGNESIFYFENLGKGEFKTVKWLSVPPVYGSSDFEWEDVNNDGHKDIVIANGDNGDFSLIRKPYHGIRIFINDGKNHFKESLFIPLQGATGLKLADFDKDGDLDIAVIANFADYSIKPHRSFVLYDNLGNLKFEPYVSDKTDIGRWLVLEKGDFDADGDTDLILGSHLINLMVERETLITWKNHQTDVLVLKNKSK